MEGVEYLLLSNFCILIHGQNSNLKTNFFEMNEYCSNTKSLILWPLKNKKLDQIYIFLSYSTLYKFSQFPPSSAIYYFMLFCLISYTHCPVFSKSFRWKLRKLLVIYFFCITKFQKSKPLEYYFSTKK